MNQERPALRVTIDQWNARQTAPRSLCSARRLLNASAAPLLCATIALFCHSVRAQDPSFSQYYAAPLYLNPALTGAEKDIVFGLNYRNQWQSLGAAQYTSQFSVIVPVAHPNPRRMSPYALGFSVSNDVAGENGHWGVSGASASFSYNLPFDKLASQMLTVSGQAGVIQKKIDLSGLQWGSQFDPSVGYNPALVAGAGQNTERTTFPSVQAGAAWFFHPFKDRWFRGFSAFSGVSMAHLNQPNESFLANSPSRLPAVIKVHGGAEWDYGRSFSFAPTYLWMRQGGHSQINVGAYFNYRSTSNNRRGGRHTKGDATRLSLGGWYRLGDSFIVATGLSRKQLAFAFSYDFNVSTLRQYTRGRGAYEVSMSYRIIRSSALRRFSTPLM